MPPPLPFTRLIRQAEICSQLFPPKNCVELKSPKSEEPFWQGPFFLSLWLEFIVLTAILRVAYDRTLTGTSGWKAWVITLRPNYSITHPLEKSPARAELSFPAPDEISPELYPSRDDQWDTFLLTASYYSAFASPAVSVSSQLICDWLLTSAKSYDSLLCLLSAGVPWTRPLWQGHFPLSP